MTDYATIAIRQATPADIDAIMTCERQPGYEDTVGRWTAAEHEAGMGDPSQRYLAVVAADDAVIGFLIMQQIGTGDAVLVRRIAIREQGRGLGRGLLGHALGVIFGELGAKKAWLRVWPHNARGMALYSGLGMREDGRSEAQRNGAPAWMTIMSIDAETFRDRNRRSSSP